MQTEAIRAKYRAHEPEIDGENDCPYRDQGYFFGDSYGDKDFQCDILHEKVDRLANRETNAVFEIDFCFERIVIGQEEVAGEADNESGCKRYIDIEIHIQHGLIYAV